MFKHPKTRQEKSAVIDAREQGVKIRGKRLASNLPCAWDDKARSDASDRCWKRYRKNQWK